MKNRKVSGSLFSLLARNYLLFTLTLLMIAGAVFCLWNARLSQLFQPVDWAGLLADERLAAGDYEGLCAYLGGSGDFAVCNDEGIVVYASGPGFAPLYTQGELACIWPYGDRFTIDAYEEPAEGGSFRYLLIRRSYGADGELEMMDILALDKEYQVVFGGFGDGRTSYTRQEYQFLSVVKSLPRIFLQPSL